MRNAASAMASDPVPNPSATASPAAARVRLEVGQLNDVTFSAVLSLVARYPPFSAFSFGLMVERLYEQLRHGANVLAIENGRLVAYAGWLRVNQAQAELWQSGAAEMPPIDWQGDAAIVTVTVAERRNLLVPLLHGISHVCAGVPVYRMRSFQDGRPDIRRPPITGRHYKFS